MIASFLSSSAKETESFASLKSPFFDSTQHPNECFSFWFEFGAEKSEQGLMILLENQNNEPMDTLWFLLDTYTTEDKKWILGRVQIKIDNPSEITQYRVYFTLI